MAKTFYINDFLRLVSAGILQDYYASINLPFDYDKSLSSEDLVDFVLDHYKNLDNQTQASILIRTTERNILTHNECS